MSKTRVCPWWLGYVLASPVRAWLQDPDAIVQPHIQEGMKVLEVGPGMGFFSIPMARRVGASGRVICVDVQQRMLNGLRRRAVKAGVADRIECRLAGVDGSLGVSDLAGSVDFAFLFAVVHEVPDQERLLTEVSDAMKAGARLLISEPKGHVKPADFDRTIGRAEQTGLSVVEAPLIRRSISRLFQKR